MYLALPQTNTPEPSGEWENLTPREMEILQLIAQAASNREIAQTLFISEKTVRKRFTNILLFKYLNLPEFN